MKELVMRNLVSVDGERCISGSASYVEIVDSGKVIGRVHITAEGLSISVPGVSREMMETGVGDGRIWVFWPSPAKP